MKILVTCPPMLKSIDLFRDRFAELGYAIHTPTIQQVMSEEELEQLLPEFDGWIIGDDPATEKVFKAGSSGKLKAAVKWGVGVDNVDFNACKKFGISIDNTPGMFGKEVADIALGYVISLARDTFTIHEGVVSGKWPKPPGISLEGKKVGLVGFGDIGKNTAQRLLVCGMNVIVYDPFYKPDPNLQGVLSSEWPGRLNELDFLVFTCALTKDNYHMLNIDTIPYLKKGVRLVNVARGPLIDESALIHALEKEIVHSAALEVFENEPLPLDSPLRNFKQCIFGTHNGSNTVDAVVRTSDRSIDIIHQFLKS